MNNLALEVPIVDVNQQFIKSTNAQIVIRGRFYYQSDKILMLAEILNPITAEIIKRIGPIEGGKENASKVLEELSQRILGYWMIEGEIFVGRKVPIYKAFQAYEKAEEYWGVNPWKSEELLKEAFQTDSTFYFALFKLFPLYSNLGRRDLKDSLINYINGKNFPFNTWETWRFGSQASKTSKGYAEATYQMYLIDPQDYTSNYAAAFGQVRIHHFTKAKNILYSYNDPYENKHIKEHLRNYKKIELRPGLLINIHYDLGEYDKVLAVIDSVFYENYFEWFVNYHVLSLARLDSLGPLNYYLEFYEKKDVITNGVIQNLVQALAHVCREMYLMGNAELLKEYSDELIQKID